MKKYLILSLVAMCIFSCAEPTIYTWDRKVLYRAYDFREYSAKGFMFYNHSYEGGEFDVLALVEFEELPLFKRVACTEEPEAIKQYTDRGYTYRVVSLNTSYYCVVIGEADPDALIRACYERCVELGANAMVDFQIVHTEMVNGSVSIPTITARGTAIRRK